MLRNISVLLSILLVLFPFAFGQSLSNQIEVIEAIAPQKYPPAALAVRVTGKVEVEAQINSDGYVETAKAISGHPLLRTASEEAVKKWKFNKSSNSGSLRKFTAALVYEGVSGNEKYVSEASEIVSESHLESILTSSNQLRVFVSLNSVIPETLLLKRVNGRPEEKYCEVHHAKMGTEIVKIVYGLTLPNKGFEDLYEVSEKLFPNANTAIYAGCLVDYTKNEEVYYCKKCRKVKEDWLEARYKKLEKMNKRASKKQLIGNFKR